MLKDIIKNIKHNMKYNKKFVQIPILQLVDKIKYKAKLNGIKVKFITEEYTSGCSAFDLEKVDKTNYNVKRRIYRGLFKTNTELLVNSDINGSLNILRKYIKYESIPKLIIDAMDKGYTSTLVKPMIA